MEDMSSQPVKRSKEFYEALVLLGGSPEDVAPYLDQPEAEVADNLAQARGRLVIHHHAGLGGSVPGGPGPLRSNWGARCR